MLQTRSPIGAPAPKVAKAIDRASEGGNDDAIIPTFAFPQKGLIFCLIEHKEKETHCCRDDCGTADSLEPTEDIEYDGICVM